MRMIQSQRVDVGGGVRWIGDGFRNFARNPGIWIVITVIVIILFAICAAVPFIGFLAVSLLGPVVGGGMLFAAREAQAQRPVEAGQLFAAFKDSRALNGLLALGGVTIAGTLATLVVCFLLLGNFFMAAFQLMQGAAVSMAFGVSTLIGVLIVVAIQFAMAAAVIYAIPLVMFKAASVGEAMWTSIGACAVNFLPLLVFGVIYLVLAIVASAPFGLGWLVLLPASAGMLYASYRDIFGD
jgi:hypothetical protein